MDDSLMLREALEKIEKLNTEVARLKALLFGTDEAEGNSVRAQIREINYALDGRPGNGAGIKTKVGEMYEYQKTVKTIFNVARWSIGFFGISTLAGIVAVIQWILKLK